MGAIGKFQRSGRRLSAAAANTFELRRQQPVALLYGGLDMRIIATAMSTRELRAGRCVGGESALRFVAPPSIG